MNFRESSKTLLDDSNEFTKKDKSYVHVSK